MPASGPAVRRAYGAGILLCVVLPLVLQAGLTRIVPPGQNPAGEILQQIGYTFTGLSCLVLALGARRLRRARAAGPAPAAAAREILLASLLFLLCAALGSLYWALGGGLVERHARTFIALSPLGFLVLVPRPSRWMPRSGHSQA